MSDWLQIAGRLHVLPAVRGDEQGSYLWLDAGELREAVVAELFLPAVPSDQLDNAMGIATGSVHIHGEQRMGDVQLRFGRVGESSGVLWPTAACWRPMSASSCFAIHPTAASAHAAAASSWWRRFR